MFKWLHDEIIMFPLFRSYTQLISNLDELQRAYEDEEIKTG